MIAAVLYGPVDLRIEDVPRPTPRPGDLLVRVEACGVCPSDIRIWRTAVTDRVSMPAILGHETVGTVVDAGRSADAGLVGRRVYVDGYGGYAEYSIESERSIMAHDGPFLVEPTLRVEDAVFVEPLADCLFAVDHCGDAAGARTAVVFGCGQMGLQLVALCALRGLDVVAVDPIDDRRALAVRYGASIIADGGPGVVDAVLNATSGGADLAIVAAPSLAAFRHAVDSLRAGGTCVVFSSMPAERVPLDIERVHRLRLSIVGSRWVVRRTRPHYELYREAERLLGSGSVRAGEMVDLRVPLERLEEAFVAMESRAALKAIVVPGSG